MFTFNFSNEYTIDTVDSRGEIRIDTPQLVPSDVMQVIVVAKDNGLPSLQSIVPVFVSILHNESYIMTCRCFKLTSIHIRP